MCSLCRLPVAKNHNFGQILTFLGTPVPTPFYRWGPNVVCYSRPWYTLMYVKFGVLQQAPGLDWHAKFHLNVFIVLASGGQKTQFWAHFDIFGGSCTDPLLQRGPNVVCYSTPMPMVYVYVPNFVSIGLFCCPLLAKNLDFCRFWTLAFSVVANWQQSEKVEHGCTTTNLPLSNGIKIVYVLQRLHGEIRRTISDIQKRDEQTKK